MEAQLVFRSMVNSSIFHACHSHSTTTLQSWQVTALPKHASTISFQPCCQTRLEAAKCLGTTMQKPSVEIP